MCTDMSPCKHLSVLISSSELVTLTDNNGKALVEFKAEMNF